MFSLTWHQMILAGDVFAGVEFSAEVEPGLAPLDVEVEAERDAVVLVVDLQDVADLNAWNISGQLSLIYFIFIIYRDESN